MLICFEIRNRAVECWQYYLRYFPVFPLLCYLLILGTVFADCNTNAFWIIFLLVFFHAFVFVSSFVYFSWLGVSDFLVVFVQTFFTLFVFSSVTLIIGNPYTCVVDTFSYAVSGIVFFVVNLCTMVFSYWFHRHDDYPYYTPLYFQYSQEVESNGSRISQYEYSSLVYGREESPQPVAERIMGIPGADYIEF